MHECRFKRVAKMIAAHTKKRMGAIIDLDQKDLEPELYLIHFIDNLSAKFGKINTRLLEKKRTNFVKINRKTSL